jgi:hypothetical protein
VRMFGSSQLRVSRSNQQQLSDSCPISGDRWWAVLGHSASQRSQAKLLSHLPVPVAHHIVEKALAAKGFKANENDVYLYGSGMQIVCRYPDRGRLIGGDVGARAVSGGALQTRSRLTIIKKVLDGSVL